VGGAYKILKTYHATLGQVLGEKRDEGDLKTPEGIYTFTSHLRPPSLGKKFGAMAFYMDFPNAFDRIAGNTGYDIMLHATNEPERLKKNFDSQGCVVVKNEEIEEIKPYIRLNLTPILVFGELTPEYLVPGKDPSLRGFFDQWIKAWENKDLDAYVGSYHSDFSAQGMDRDAWRKYKGNLNRAYQSISIGPENIRFYRHPKYWLVTFTQNYHSTRAGGGVGHRSRGTKMLYIAEEAGQPRIIAETYTNAMW
jgi:murein L,D-transpeptidase YafK